MEVSERVTPVGHQGSVSLRRLGLCIEHLLQLSCLTGGQLGYLYSGFNQSLVKLCAWGILILCYF